MEGSTRCHSERSEESLLTCAGRNPFLPDQQANQCREEMRRCTVSWAAEKSERRQVIPPLLRGKINLLHAHFTKADFWDNLRIPNDASMFETEDLRTYNKC
jgi:hypothetical protein